MGNFIFLILISIIISTPVNSQNRKLLVVGVPAEPMRYYDKNDIVVGFDIDIIDHIFNKIGIEYSVTLIDSSPRIESEYKKGNFDILLTYSWKEEREEFLIYPRESHVTVDWNFFIRTEDKYKIFFDTFDDLNSLRVAASSGKSYTDEFWSASKSFDNFLVIPQDRLQIKMLIGNRFDIVPLETFVTKYLAKKGNYSDKIYMLPKTLKSKPYYNLFVKNSTYPNLNELIEKYDEELRLMKMDGTYDRILAKYGITE